MNYPMNAFMVLVVLFSVFAVEVVAVLAGETVENSHFKKEEFACKCGCGKVIVSPLLIHKLEQLRIVLGNRPIIITSGYRCPAHNKAVGGVPGSQHLYGLAADIKVRDVLPREVARQARLLGFYVIEYPTFTHVDIRSFNQKQGE